MTIMNRGIFLIGLIGLIGMSSMTMAAGGKADGKLIVDGKPVNLSYAYASAQPGFFEKLTEDIRVLLTSKALKAVYPIKPSKGAVGRDRSP
jgi:hypothetical protein